LRELIAKPSGSKDGGVGLNDIQQFGDDGRDALKVSRTELAIQNLRQHRYFHAGRIFRTVGVDLLHIRHEHEVAARGGQHALVLTRRARIVRIVLVGSELHGIDEDAGDKALAMLAGRLDEAHVSGMQVAHGRHECDTLALRVPAAHALANMGDGGDRFHQMVP
jgi:hypothetical protein